MKYRLLFVLSIYLCSCNNTVPTNIGINPHLEIKSEYDEIKETINNEYDSDVNKILVGQLETKIKEEFKFIPISTSNYEVLTNILSLNNNSITINGITYPKYEDSVILNTPINNKMYQDIINDKQLYTYLYINDYCVDKGLTLNNKGVVPVSNINIDNYDFYLSNNKFSTNLLLQCNDSLLGYDLLGNIKCNLAKSYEISKDKLTYTFTLKDDIYYVDSNGNKYEEIKAIDFVKGFQHMLDLNKYTSLFKNVVGVEDYLLEKTSFDEVKVKAIDDKRLSITLNNIDSNFLYLLANNYLIPLNNNFYVKNGGMYGINYLEDSSVNNNYSYGKNINNVLFTGAYYPIVDSNKVTLIKNKHHYNSSNISIYSIEFIKDNDSENNLIENINNNVYNEVYLSKGNDDSLTKYNDNSIRYVHINTNRKNYDVYNTSIKSNKTNKQIIDSENALANINFRKALFYSFNKDIIQKDNQYNSLTFYDNRLSNSINYNDKEFDKYLNYKSIIEILSENDVNHKYDTELAKHYMNIAINELSITKPIVLDVLCYVNSEKQITTINKYIENIENIFGNNLIVIDILYCKTSFDYYLASSFNYKCYDLTFDMSISGDYNNNYSYLNKLISYV